MQASIFLARPLGRLLLLPGIGLLINPRGFRTMETEVVGKVALVYLLRLTDLAWVASRRVLITLIGWLMLIHGAARVLATDWVMGYAAKTIRNKQLYPLSGAVLVVLGLVLCYFGYVA